MRNRTLPIVRQVAQTFLLCALVAPAVHADANRLFGNLSEAETTTERKQICEDLEQANVERYASLFCQGYQILAAGQDSLAVRFLEDALALEPAFAIGCVLYADHYMEQGALPQAARWYRRARAIAPDRLDPHYGLGLIALIRAETEGDSAFEEALVSFREMTRIEPDSPDGWSNIGMVQAMLGRFDEAEDSYEKARRLAPEDAEIYSSLGSLASLRGDDHAAERAWRRAIELNPTHLESVRELAALYGRSHRITEAIEVLEIGAEKVHVGEEAGRLRRDLALLNLLADRRDEAADLLERARVLSPDPRTLCALAHLRLLQGDAAAALGILSQAVEADSAVTAPFLFAWAETLRPLLDGFASDHPIGDRILRRTLAEETPSEIDSGPDATDRLVRTLLPDWKLPEGKLTMPAAPPEAGYDTAPVPIYRALAVYPEAAGGIEGTVFVLVKIDTLGVVRDTEVSSKGGNPALEWAALDAAKRWRFEPARLKGEPVACETTIPFRFTDSR